MLTDEMSSLLRDPSADADTRWRALFARLMADGPSLHDMGAAWSAILDFDPGLRDALADPLPAPGATVIVAGSGKETLKTFNVSTASALLAAAAGVPVVKGVSRSVSAVTGSADVLEQLGMPTCPDPAAIAAGLGTHGIAFVPYTAFCGRYGDRYDGVFDQLTPVSFFAPVTVLAVRARAFVLGLADARVALADAAIKTTRPDLPAGVVVSTKPVPGRVIDEYAAHGVSRMALRTPDCVKVSEHHRPPASAEWVSGVAHHADHAGNAATVRWSLQPGPVDAVRDLVERNAALILDASQGFTLSQRDALAAVQRARQDGRAAALLADITGTWWRPDMRPIAPDGPLHARLGGLLRRFSHEDNAESVLTDDVHVITGFGPTNAPTAGSLSVMLGIIDLQQRLQRPVTVVISELGAWNSRNVPWSRLVAVRDQMTAFLLELGFDTKSGEVRSHLDLGNLARAGKLARFLTRQDFLEHREDLLELYGSHGLLGSEVGVTVDALYTVADVLGPTEDGATQVLMVSGLEEAYFTQLARIALRRQSDAGDLTLGWRAEIGALYFRVLPGLAGYPKMSKSIPASAVHVGMPPDELAAKICTDEPGDQEALLEAISLASGWEQGQIEAARRAYAARREDPDAWGRVKRDYLDTFLGFAKLWQQCG